MKNIYFTCDTKTLVALSFISLGVYNIYYYYKNFELCDEKRGSDPVNFIKAVLYPYFSYSLLKQAENNRNGTYPLSAKVIFIIQFFIVVGAVSFPGPFYLMAFLAFIPLVFANGLLKGNGN